MVNVVEMEMATRVQTLDETVCISHYFGKGMNLTILFSAVDK